MERDLTQRTLQRQKEKEGDKKRGKEEQMEKIQRKYFKNQNQQDNH